MHRILVATLLLGCAPCGCSGPNAQLTRCQQDKDQLLTTIREQRDSNRALNEQVASLESRLDESEKELARLGKPGTRVSTRTLPQTPLPQTPLPWRSPGSPVDSKAATPTK